MSNQRKNLQVKAEGHLRPHQQREKQGKRQWWMAATQHVDGKNCVASIGAGCDERPSSASMTCCLRAMASLDSSGTDPHRAWRSSCSDEEVVRASTNTLSAWSYALST